MNGFKLPGVVWTVLLVVCAMLPMWLEQYFPGTVWAAPVAGLLLIVGKVVEVLQAGTDPALPVGVMGEQPSGKPAAKRASRIAWG